MTRIARTVLLGALALAVGAAAYASEPAQTKEEPSGQTPPVPEGKVWTQVKGEVIDVFCYLDRGFTGEIHRECAMICIRGGMPMGILTQEGDIYLLFPNNEWATDKTKVEYRKPYEQLIEWAARQVEVGGYLVDRQGMKGIEVCESKLLKQYLLPAGGLDSSAVMPDTTGSQAP